MSDIELILQQQRLNSAALGVSPKRAAQQLATLVSASNTGVILALGKGQVSLPVERPPSKAPGTPLVLDFARVSGEGAVTLSAPGPVQTKTIEAGARPAIQEVLVRALSQALAASPQVRVQRADNQATELALPQLALRLPPLRPPLTQGQWLRLNLTQGPEGPSLQLRVIEPTSPPPGKGTAPAANRSLPLPGAAPRVAPGQTSGVTGAGQSQRSQPSGQQSTASPKAIAEALLSLSSRVSLAPAASPPLLKVIQPMLPLPAKQTLGLSLVLAAASRGQPEHLQWQAPAWQQGVSLTPSLAQAMTMALERTSAGAGILTNWLARNGASPAVASPNATAQTTGRGTTNVSGAADSAPKGGQPKADSNEPLARPGAAAPTAAGQKTPDKSRPATKASVAPTGTNEGFIQRVGKLPDEAQALLTKLSRLVSALTTPPPSTGQGLSPRGTSGQSHTAAAKSATAPVSPSAPDNHAPSPQAPVKSPQASSPEPQARVSELREPTPKALLAMLSELTPKLEKSLPGISRQLHDWVSQLPQLRQQLAQKGIAPQHSGRILQQLETLLLTGPTATANTRALMHQLSALLPSADAPNQGLSALLASPPLALTPSSLGSITPPNNFVGALVNLVQLVLTARLSQQLPGRATVLTELVAPLMPAGPAKNAQQRRQTLTDVASADQRGQLLRNITALLSTHGQQKLGNIEQQLQQSEQFFYSLPMAHSDAGGNIELLVKRDGNSTPGENNDDEINRWALTMLLPAGSRGKVLTKAKFQPQGLEITMYASNARLRDLTLGLLPLLVKRLGELGIEVGQHSCQLGKIPDSLQQHPYQLVQTRV